MTDKRYQVFVSSTFRDLVTERQNLLKAILELDHMPAGMELFPALDDTAWALIKDVITSSDYYVLVISGRYGSLDEQGLGFTEKEYDFAVHAKKTVVALLHQNPDNLPRDKTETDPAAWKKLGDFRTKVQKKHHCVYWDGADDLKAKLITSLIANIKRHPTVGWVRADTVPSDATIRDVLTLRQRISELETNLARVQTQAPPGSEDLQQGDETFEIPYRFTSHHKDTPRNRTIYNAAIRPTWNEIFSAISPVLISEAPDHMLRKSFNDVFHSMAREDLRQDVDFNDHFFSDIAFRSADIDTCLIQFRALGMILESDKKRSVTNTQKYWTLTPYGDRVMVQLRAVRREPLSKASPGAKPEVETEDG